MKQAFARCYLCHMSCRGPPSHVWHVRNMISQAAAIEEIEVSKSGESQHQRWRVNETNVLIAAKNQHDLEKLRAIEAAGEATAVNLKKARNKWKEIETFCRERGVQRSITQCKCRWRRIIIMYSQINSWEQNRTPELLSYWSMTPDERKANGFILSYLDKSTYNLLDELYDARGDAIKDDLKEDVVEKVAEFRSLEHMDHPEEAYQPTGTLFPSAGAPIQPERQNGKVAGTTASLEGGDTANSASSSMGQMFCQEMRNGQVAGAAEPVEKMLGDQTQSEQVTNTAVSVGETHKGFRESPDFTEVKASIELLSRHASGTATSVPVVETAGGFDKSASLMDNMEPGDTSDVNNLPVLVEGTQEQQTTQVTDSAACFEESHQSMTTGTLFSSTGVPIQSEGQNGKGAGAAASPGEACEGLRASGGVVSTEGDVSDEMQSENVACSVAVSLEETHQSQDKSSQFLSRGGEIVHEWPSGQVAELVAVAEEACAGQRASDHFDSDRVEAFGKMLNQQAPGNEISKNTSLATSLEEITESQYTSTQFITTGVEAHHGGQSGQVDRFAFLKEEASEGYRASSHFSSTGVELFDEMQSEQVTGNVASSSKERFQSQKANTPSSVSGGEINQERHTKQVGFTSTEQVSVTTFLKEAREGERTNSNVVSVVEVFNELPRKQVAASGSSKSTSGSVSTTLENRHLLCSQESQVFDPVLAQDTVDTSKTVAGKGLQYSNGEVNQEICEGKGAKTLEKPATEAKVVAVRDDQGSPAISEKVRVEGQGLQPYHGGKCDDDIVMYIPAAIGNVIKSVSRTLKKLFKV